jgi:hypothetical protein
MNRDISYNDKLICDNCGNQGAYDFMGDYYCSDCAVGCKRCGVVFIKNLKQPREKLCPECKEKIKR